MTREKLQCLIPVVFTVGPDVNKRGKNGKGFLAQSTDGQDDQQQQEGQQDNTLVAQRAAEREAADREDGGDALMKYAMLLSGSKKGKNDLEILQHIENIVKGIIEGETRVLVSSMTMEEIFSEREQFKDRIFRGIQSEMDQVSQLLLSPIIWSIVRFGCLQ